jgi:CRISPR-associated endonuclease Csy4
MQFFLEVTALPNEDLPEGAVVSSLMRRIHRLLPSYEGRVGLSFPLYARDRTPGSCIRAHGSAEDMGALYEDMCFTPAIVDYAFVEEPKACPSGNQLKGYHAYVRVQARGTSRLRRQEARHRRRGTWSPELEKRYKILQAEELTLPYFNMCSDTNGHHFLLFIERKTVKEPREGLFGAYGLNSRQDKNQLVTVPWFD